MIKRIWVIACLDDKGYFIPVAAGETEDLAARVYDEWRAENAIGNDRWTTTQMRQRVEYREVAEVSGQGPKGFHDVSEFYRD